MMIPSSLRPTDLPVAPPQQAAHQQSFTGLRVHFSSEAEASQAYAGARARFADTSVWFQTPPVPDGMKLHYRLVGPGGTPIIGRGPQVGDYGQVHVGDGPKVDWVHIEAVGRTPDMASFTFRPSAAPTGAAAGETTHFYERSATNTMTIWRDGKDVISTVQIRNVRPNILDQMPDLARRTRNKLFWYGSEVGGQKYMWDTWVGESALASVRATGRSGAYLLRPRNVEGYRSLIPEVYSRGVSAAVHAAHEGITNLLHLGVR